MTDKIADIPYIAHEGAMVRLERINKRLWILALILVALLFLTNGGWLYYESQMETVSSISQDIDTGNGDANITGIGNIYGESKADHN